LFSVGGSGELSITYHMRVALSNELERAVSTPRLTTYGNLTHDDATAWALYRWNLDLSVAWLPVMADTEVALRNGIHHQLSNLTGRPDWWSSDRLVFDDETAENLSRIVRAHQKKIVQGKIGAGKVVADLMFSVWVMLLGKGGKSSLGRSIDYETNLWRPALRFAFATGTTTRTGRPRRPTQEQVHRRAANLQRLRNRVAHHEPIFNGIKSPGTNNVIPLLTVWEETLELLSWLCPELANLHVNTQRVTTLLASHP
jgi:hypothetical protein